MVINNPNFEINQLASGLRKELLSLSPYAEIANVNMLTEITDEVIRIPEFTIRRKFPHFFGFPIFHNHRVSY